jgi:hypothetical protein
MRLVLACAALLWVSPSVAQECVSCRSARCSGMFWIDPCKSGGKAKPNPIDKSKPVDKLATDACEPGQPLKLAVDFPAKVHERDLLGIRIRAACRAWLVVYYLEENGPGAVLWPSTWEPAPTVDAAHPASLPSTREADAHQSLQAQLRKPGVPTHETFIVYAFAERADFDRLKPPPGGSSDDGARYAAALQPELAKLPTSRWAQVSAHYTIEPQK